MFIVKHGYSITSMCVCMYRSTRVSGWMLYLSLCPCNPLTDTHTQSVMLQSYTHSCYGFGSPVPLSIKLGFTCHAFTLRAQVEECSVQTIVCVITDLCVGI